MPTIHRRVERDLQHAQARLRRFDVAWPKSEWRPEHGNVLWWSFPVQELPFVGHGDDEALPDWATHWTPLVVPKVGAQ